MYRSRTTATARRSGRSAGARSDGLFGSSSLNRQTLAAVTGERSRSASFVPRYAVCSCHARELESASARVCVLGLRRGVRLELGVRLLFPLPPALPPPNA